MPRMIKLTVIDHYNSGNKESKNKTWFNVAGIQSVTNADDADNNARTTIQLINGDYLNVRETVETVLALLAE